MDLNVKDAVQSLYGATARGVEDTDSEGVSRVAEAFGYSADELSSIPEGSNLGLSCGNPTATANLHEGETVLDLGSGGGLDVFLAAKVVGPTGTAIGLDMTEDMIALAKRNAERGGYTNTEFVLGDIENMPIESGSVDCVISNCVINLCPDKDAAFAEIARVLKPGGRVAISDIALRKTLPRDLKTSLDAYVGCIAGAIKIDAIEGGLKQAGLSDILVVDDEADLNAYSEVDEQQACCSPAASCGPSPQETDVHGALRETMKSYDLNEFALSVKIYAVKPT